MVSNCNKFYYVQSGDGCWTIANNSGITLDQLYAWNPALNGDCSGLFPDYYVCVGVQGSATTTVGSTTVPATTTSPAIVTPTPYPANMAPGCTQFYYTVDGDYCDKITQQFGITLDQFVAWNPDVGDTSNCAVWLNYYYCVAH